jgi:hypothetical protein
MIRRILVALALAVSACTFTPEPGTPRAMGADCTRDGQCSSGLCGVDAPGKCVACRGSDGCASGQRCELGACIGPTGGIEHVASPGAHRRTNDAGRVHVGRVAVVPVVTEVSR